MEEVKSRRIGILGGTFDPIHIGHLRASLEVACLLRLDEVRFLPNRRPPHRGMPRVSIYHRLNMIRCAILGEKKFSLSTDEIERDAPSYTVETLKIIRYRLNPSDKIFLLIGLDSFYTLPTWHSWEEIIQYTHIVVMNRLSLDKRGKIVKDIIGKKYFLENFRDFKNPNGSIAFIEELTPLGVSASQIRRLLFYKKSARFLVPDRVGEYIDSHRLYQNFG